MTDTHLPTQFVNAITRHQAESYCIEIVDACPSWRGLGRFVHDVALAVAAGASLPVFTFQKKFFGRP
jgi:hypothetical protein